MLIIIHLLLIVTLDYPRKMDQNNILYFMIIIIV
jgi:hypothetical protein